MMGRVLRLRDRFTSSPEEAVLGKLLYIMGLRGVDRVGLQLAIRVVSQ